MLVGVPDPETREDIIKLLEILERAERSGLSATIKFTVAELILRQMIYMEVTHEHSPD